MERILKIENFKTERLEQNIKLLLFFHLIKIICFIQIMKNLPNETENPF